MAFTQKNFIQILQDEIDHLSASTGVSDFNTGSVIRTFFESVALVIDEAYFQLVNILNGFYINTATGSDLDRRASDFGLSRKQATQANVLVIFSGSGSPAIPAGTIVAVPAAGGNPQINFFTTQTNTINIPIPAVCQEFGIIGNVAANSITLIQTNTNPLQVTSVTNPAKAVGGQELESDSVFRARIQLFLQSLSKATVNSIMSAAANVTGVKIVSILENFALTGYDLSPVVDYSNGATLGAQVGSIVVFVDDGNGSLDSTLVPEIYKIINGDILDPINFPGYRAAGIQSQVSRPQNQTVNVAVQVKVKDFVIDTQLVVDDIEAAVADFIQNHNIGDNLYLSQIIDQAMNVNGVLYVVEDSLLFNGTNADFILSTKGQKVVSGTVVVTAI